MQIQISWMSGAEKKTKIERDVTWERVGREETPNHGSRIILNLRETTDGLPVPALYWERY